MSTLIRPVVSIKNPYWIEKFRFYELKYYCYQYPEWKREYLEIESSIKRAASFTRVSNIPAYDISDRVGDIACRLASLAIRIERIERICKETDKSLWHYLLLGVTEGRSYTYLSTVLEMPCGKDMYYDRFRKFYWLLSNELES